ncbi:transporter, partial [Bacillus cereus]
MQEKLWLHKNFLLLTFGNVTSKLGSKIYEVMLAWWLVEKTGSAKLFGMVTAAGLISVVVCNIFSGVIADRFNKKHILIISDLISAIVCIIVGLFVMNDVLHVPILVLAAILLGITNSLFTPTLKAILPSLIEKEMIVSANSITTVISQVVTVSAPLIAGMMIKGFSFGLGVAFLVNGITYFVSAISELCIKYCHKVEKTSKNIKFLTDIKEGYSYVKNQKWLLHLIYVSAVVNLFIAAYNTILPMYFLHSYSDDGSLYSYALGAEAVFAIIAGIVISKKKNDNPTPASLKKELIFCGVPIILLQLIQVSYISILLVGFFGYYLTKFNIYFFSIVQREVSKDKLGRVFSIIFMVALSIMPLGNLIFGLFSNQIISFVFIITGAGIIISTLLIKVNDLEDISIENDKGILVVK